MTQKAVILFSSGLDSTTCLAIAKSKGFECYAMSFDYGQRHRIELENAVRLAKHYGAVHQIFKLNLGEFGGSALTDQTINVPDHIEANEIPVTYVPARNTIFLSIALGWAEVLGARDIFIGVSCTDYSGYPDCRPEYIAAFEKLANLATKAGIEGDHFHIHTPLLYLSKAETIKKGLALEIDYSQTISCYRADEKGRACGTCDSCHYRKKGFEEAGILDPTRYLKS